MEAVEAHLAVSSVVTHQQVVLAGESHRLGEKFKRRSRCCGIARVVQPQQPGAFQIFSGMLSRSGKKSRSGSKGQIVRLPAGKKRRPLSVGYITRVGDQHHIARVDDRQRQVEDALLRAQ